MDIVDRIQALVNAKGLSIAALERNVGLSNGIIKKWKKQSPSCDKIISIANYLNTSIEYLILGKTATNGLAYDVQQLLDYYNQLDKLEKGMVLGKAETLAELATERKTTERAAALPKKTIKIAAPDADELPNTETKEQEKTEEFYIDLFALPASAGTGVQLDGNYTEPMRIKHTRIAERANYAVRVSGNSMEDKYYDGDIVLVETCPEVEIGEIGLFMVNDKGYIKKRGKDRLISLNPKSPDVKIKDGDVVYCRGRVLGKAEILE